MPEAVKSWSAEKTSDEIWSHEDNIEHEEDDYSEAEWEQTQTDLGYIQHMRCQDK